MTNDSHFTDTTPDALRKKHRHARAEFNAETLERHAVALAANVTGVDEFTAAQTVASYIAIRGEIDVQPLMHQHPNKRYYLPVLRGQSMHFAPWQPGDSLVKKDFGLLEPDVSDKDWIEPAALDVVLMPLVVFDQYGNRIGQGGGFYDRTFAFLHGRQEAATPVLLGVAHDSQREPELIAEAWDVPLDLIATERTVYRR